MEPSAKEILAAAHHGCALFSLFDGNKAYQQFMAPRATRNA
ncbi:hypothetical protein [Paracidovorax anthurii]|nr:hypothetical protein [Paracidovorax anthurii]